MPTYEYLCDACEHQFDEFQSMADEPLKKCPKCGKKKLRRLLGAGAGLIFRGSGFYITDYRSDSYKSAAKADQESSNAKTTETKDSSTKSESGKKSSPSSTKSPD